MCNCLVSLLEGSHWHSTTQDKCPECDSAITEVDFNKKTTPLNNGATFHKGCILQRVAAFSHGNETRKYHFLGMAGKDEVGKTNKRLSWKRTGKQLTTRSENEFLRSQSTTGYYTTNKQLITKICVGFIYPYCN